MLWTKFLEKMKIHFILSNFFFKSYHLRDNVEKFCRVGQARGDNMAHVHCMLHT